jgi:hypothetical protein
MAKIKNEVKEVKDEKPVTVEADPKVETPAVTLSMEPEQSAGAPSAALPLDNEQFNAAGSFASGIDNEPVIQSPTDPIISDPSLAEPAANEAMTEQTTATDASASNASAEQPPASEDSTSALSINIGEIAREGYRRMASLLEGSSFPPFDELDPETQQIYLESAQSVIDRNPTRTTFEEQVREVLNG